MRHLKTGNEQGTYALGFVQISDIKQQRHGKYDSAGDSRCQCSASYFLLSEDGKTLQVCKLTFMTTFGLKHRFVQTLQSRIKKGISLYKDQRGINDRQSKFTENNRTMVIADINTYPRDISHYGRQKSKKECLSTDIV